MMSKQVRLIGLHGKAQHGKDTIYKILNEQLDFPVQRDAFADRLKLSAIRNFFPTIDLKGAYAICERLKADGGAVMIADRDGELEVVSGREFLQHYGTEAHRQVFADDFWISAVLPDLSDPLHFGRTFDEDPWNLLVITDVRFPNEAEAIRKAGGVIWHVIRPELEQGDADPHPSEQPLPEELIDSLIINGGSLDDLRELVGLAWKFAGMTDEIREFKRDTNVRI